MRNQRPNDAEKKSSAKHFLIGVAAVLTLFAATIDGTIAGADEGGSCGEYNFDFTGTRLLNDGISQSAGPFSIELPAGTYDVTLMGADEHTSAEHYSDQPGEQWYVALDNGWQSDLTDDLPEDQDMISTTFSGVTVESATAISVHHAGEGNVNSIAVLCVGFTPTGAVGNDIAADDCSVDEAPDEEAPVEDALVEDEATDEEAADEDEAASSPLQVEDEAPVEDESVVAEAPAEDDVCNPNEGSVDDQSDVVVEDEATDEGEAPVEDAMVEDDATDEGEAPVEDAMVEDDATDEGEAPVEDAMVEDDATDEGEAPVEDAMVEDDATDEGEAPVEDAMVEDDATDEGEAPVEDATDEA